jgi:hypothetical protein
MLGAASRTATHSADACVSIDAGTFPFSTPGNGVGRLPGWMGLTACAEVAVPHTIAMASSTRLIRA